MPRSVDGGLASDSSTRDGDTVNNISATSWSVKLRGNCNLNHMTVMCTARNEHFH